MKAKSFQELLDLLKKGDPITVDAGRTLFYENAKYFEETALSGRKEISLEEAQGYLRIMVARWRRERREQHKKEKA